MITVTINGKEIKLEKPVTVLEAARGAGIKIPTLCYHQQLEKYGGCRLCLVEVEKMPRLQTACTLMTADGMVVRTETEAVANVRRGVLEFLLINHPLDCPYCDKAGECELQDLVEKYGPTTGRFKEKKRKVPESLQDPVLVRNMERCVMCTRCVRMCDGVQGASAIGVISRGGHSHIEPFSGGRFECEYCGNCVSACPVGAIMSRLHRHSYRPWQLVSETRTICPYCGVGCTLIVQVRDEAIKRVVPRIGTPVNNGLLCSRGRFGYEFVGSTERLTTPLIKKNGVLEQATWEEAISLVARRLGEVRAKDGSDAIAGIASPRCTNEDNYLFQKFMRVVIGTNNIDSTARTGYAGGQAFIENIFGQGATANLIPGLANADAVLVAGGDPTTVNPILGLQIRSCGRKGGAILTVGHVKGLRHYNPVELRPQIHTETALLEGIISALVEKKGLPGSHHGLDEKIREIGRTAAEAAGCCSVAAKDLAAFVNSLAAASTPAIVIGKEMVQAEGGSYNLLLLSAIAYLVNGRIYLLSERANEQGLLDMGCAPDVLPGNRPLSYAEFRKRYEAAWKAPVPDKAGMTIFEMVTAAAAGSLKALYVMGENPVFNLPGSRDVAAALGKLEFLVVQDIFMTDTARMADVVLPALAWSEKEGTFTNMERRLQRLGKAVTREGLEDWRIIAEVAANMGAKMRYESAADVFAEISKVSPLHRDLSLEEIEHGVLYPYKGEPLRGASSEIRYQKPAAAPADGLFLGIERPLFHSGTLSSRAPGLVKIYETPVARISPVTAASKSLRDGDIVRVSSSAATLELPVAVDMAVGDGSVMICNNFEGRGAFSLIRCVTEPVLQAPIMDRTAVTLERVTK